MKIELVEMDRATKLAFVFAIVCLIILVIVSISSRS